MDKKNKNIDPVKSAFESKQLKAPKGIWDELNHKLDADPIDIFVSEAFNSQTKKAPETVWTGVKKQIILDEVWTKIESTLDKDKRKRGLLFWNFFIGITAVIGLLIYLNFSNNNLHQHLKQPSHELSEKNHKNKNENDEIRNENAITNQSSSEIIYSSNQQLKTTNQHSSSNHDSTLISTNSTTAVTTHDAKRELMMQDENFTLNTHENNPSNYTTELNNDLAKNIPDVEIEPIKTPFKSYFELGIGSSLNNTWIFNNDVKDGFRRYSLVSNKFSLGYEFGIIGIYHFNSSNSIGAQADFFSIHNQSYSYFEHGQILDYKITLSQYKLDLFYRHQNQIFKKNDLKFVQRYGIYSAFNKNVSESILGKSSYQNTLSKIDLGVVAGLGFQKSFGKLNTEFGIQTNAGIMNLTLDSENSSKKFNYTSTFLSGIYFNITYSLGK